jgi:hypothetical protein
MTRKTRSAHMRPAFAETTPLQPDVLERPLPWVDTGAQRE